MYLGNRGKDQSGANKVNERKRNLKKKINIKPQDGNTWVRKTSLIKSKSKFTKKKKIWKKGKKKKKKKKILKKKKFKTKKKVPKRASFCISKKMMSLTLSQAKRMTEK